MIISHVLLRIMGPIFFFLLLGYLAVRSGKMSSSQGGTLIGYVINVAIPCMIIVDLNGQPLANYLPYLRFLGVFLLVTVITFSIACSYAFYIKKYSTLTGSYFAAMSSLSNTCMIALPILVLLMPKQGATYGVLGLIALIMGLQTMSFIYEWTHTKDSAPWKNIITSFYNSVFEPYFIAFIIGVILSAFAIKLPSDLRHPLQMLGSTTAPVALFAIGVQLDFSSLRQHLRTVFECCVFKLFVMPAIAWPICMLLHLSPCTVIAVVVCSAVASAKCQYALAKQKNVFVQESGAIIAATTILSFMTLVFIISALYAKFPAYF